MNSKTFIIKELKRTLPSGENEVLNFELGINVIVGEGNTGKTKWLQMLDYLLGDTSTPEEAFGETLTEKYDSIEGLFFIGEEEFHIKRAWKHRGMKSKIIINDEPIVDSEFSNFLLSKLEIPIIHFPQGSPYSERKWPLLSWRTLFRHIYRQQRFWADFADKQPESEQFACLVQFMGLAQFIFSDEYNDLVSKKKRIAQLQVRKEEFLKLLDEISKDLVEEKEVQVTITKPSVDIAIKRLSDEINLLQSQREQILQHLLETVEQPINQEIVSDLGNKWGELQNLKEEIILKLAKIEKRIEELKIYKINLNNELTRLQRTQVAGRLLVDIKITHCPACDQPVYQSSTDPEVCFLCHQAVTNQVENQIPKRIDYEAEQIREELSEINRLLETLITDQKETKKEYQRIKEKIQSIDDQLKPTRKAIASITPPELGIIDINKGRLQERIKQLEKIKTMFDRQNELSEEIDQLQKELVDLEVEVKKLSQNVNFEKATDILTEGMNTYLNALVSQGKNIWRDRRVNFRLRNKDFIVTISGEDWTTKLGGTLTLYFFFSYHYTLLQLTAFQDKNYPGFLIIDLPATLEDNSTVKDKENFIIEPFKNLLMQQGMGNCQIIATGASFEGLEGVNRIELTTVWK